MEADELAVELRRHRQLARILREHRSRILREHLKIHILLGQAAGRCKEDGSYKSKDVANLARKLKSMSGCHVSETALYKAAKVVREFGTQRLRAATQAGIPWYKLIKYAYSDDPMQSFKEAMNEAGKARRAQPTKTSPARQESRSRRP